jgi:hypothetical protein
VVAGWVRSNRLLRCRRFADHRLHQRLTDASWQTDGPAVIPSEQSDGDDDDDAVESWLWSQRGPPWEGQGDGSGFVADEH